MTNRTTIALPRIVTSEASSVLLDQGLEIWCRADLGIAPTASGSYTVATTWYNRAQNNYNLTQPVTNLAPVLVTGSMSDKPSLQFGTKTSVMYFPLMSRFNTTGGGEMFAVMKSSVPVGTGNFIWDELGAAANDDCYITYTDSKIYDNFGSTVRKITGVIANNITIPFVYDVSSITSEWKCGINGVNIYTTGVNTVGFTTTTGTSYLGYGSITARLLYFAEILLYSRKLTTAERNGVLTYLGNRYGISVTLS